MNTSQSIVVAKEHRKTIYIPSNHDTHHIKYVCEEFILCT